MNIRQHMRHPAEGPTAAKPRQQRFTYSHQHFTYSVLLAALLVFGAVADSLAQVSFPAATDFELTSDTPNDIALADFNGDGDLDVAISLSGAAGGDAGISVVMTDGLGGFDQDQPFSPGFGAYGLAAGDLNSDTFQDLAVAGIFGSGSTPQVRIFLGNGAGVLTAATPSNILSASGFPVAIVTGNFNGDANLDLAVANSQGGILVYLGDGTIGTGTGFGAAQTIASSSHNPRDLIATDFDGDGDIDLATPSAVYLGAGNGTFSLSDSLGGGKSLAAGDLNNDGDLDVTVVLASSGSDVLDTWIGAGDGTFTFGARTTLQTTAQVSVKIAVADMDADGFADVVASDRPNNALKVIPGLGNGSFGTAQSFSTGTNPAPVIIGDWNSDGWLDMAGAYANLDAPGLSVFFQTPPGPSAGTLQFNAATYSAAENSASTTITVTRTGGSAGIATANYATSNGTATVTEDYSAANGTVTFADGSMTSQTFTVSLLDDTVYEGDEQYR